VSRYQKGKTNLDFTEARDSEWQWHQLGRMQVCTSLQTDNHDSTPPLSFLQAGCPSRRPTNSVKALKTLALKAFYPVGNTHKIEVKIERAVPEICSRTDTQTGTFITIFRSPNSLLMMVAAEPKRIYICVRLVSGRHSVCPVDR